MAFFGKKGLLQRVHTPKSRPKKEFPKRLASFSVLDDDDDDGRPDDNFRVQRGPRGANGGPTGKPKEGHHAFVAHQIVKGGPSP
jgi:hypothetical protein